MLQTVILLQIMHVSVGIFHDSCNCDAIYFWNPLWLLCLITCSIVVSMVSFHNVSVKSG